MNWPVCFSLTLRFMSTSPSGVGWMSGWTSSKKPVWKMSRIVLRILVLLNLSPGKICSSRRMTLSCVLVFPDTVMSRMFAGRPSMNVNITLTLRSSISRFGSTVM